MSQLNFATAKVKTLVANITITGAAAGTANVISITAAGHGLETGDIVSISGVVGTVEANGRWTVTRTSSSVFTLNNSQFVTAYTSGGTAVHIGFAAAFVLTDATVFPTAPNYTLQGRVENLTAGNARVSFEDTLDTTGKLGQDICLFQRASTLGPTYDSVMSFPKYDIPSYRVGVANSNTRVKVLLDGGPGTVCQFSAWMTY